MKNKKLMIAACAVVLLAVLAVVVWRTQGPGTGGRLTTDASEPGRFFVTAEDAIAGSGGGSFGGGFTVEEGQQMTAYPNLSKGTIAIRLLDSDGNLAYDVPVSGTESVTVQIAPGEYSIAAQVTEKANGTVEVLAEAAE